MPSISPDRHRQNTPNKCTGTMRQTGRGRRGLGTEVQPVSSRTVDIDIQLQRPFQYLGKTLHL